MVEMELIYVLIAVFVFCLGLGMPLFFVMGVTAMALIFNKGGLPLMIIPQRSILGAESIALMAVPFFILAGNLMNYGGITKRIIRFSNILVGWMRGGLALANIVASMVFAGVSGSAVADASSIGSMLIPAMKDEGYDADFSAAVTAASSICGPIIPPSIPMVIYALTAMVSVGTMFLAGAIPGILLGLALLIYTYRVSVKRNYPKYKKVTFRESIDITINAVWALIMPLIILGGIFSGVFTVTESASVAVLYSFLVAWLVYKEIRLKDLPAILVQSAVDTAGIMIIIAVASLFGWMLAITRIPHLMTSLVAEYSPNVYIFLLLVNIFFLFVGTFMEAISAMVILIPLFMPILPLMGVDPVHFGVIMVFNLMLGLLTPPVGLCLYITGNIAKVRLEKVITASFPFLLVGLVVLALITYFPGLVLFLPNLWKSFL